jgi:hypothetical protein
MRLLPMKQRQRTADDGIAEAAKPATMSARQRRDIAAPLQ